MRIWTLANGEEVTECELLKVGALIEMPNGEIEIPVYARNYYSRTEPIVRVEGVA